MFSSVVCFVLFAVVLGRSVPQKLGVEITEPGKVKIAVDGDALKYTQKGCSEGFTVLYPTTKEGTYRPGLCSIGEARGQTKCPLKFDADELLEIEVEELPPGCAVTFTNAFYPKKDDEYGGRVPIAAIVTSSVIGFVLVLLGLALLGYFVVWPCYKRQRTTSRATRTADALPTPSASDIPISTTLGKKRSTTEQTSNIPMPSSSNARDRLTRFKHSLAN